MARKAKHRSEQMSVRWATYREIVLVALSSLLATHCAPARTGDPSISFTRLPPFSAGSSDKLDPIEGRVRNVGPGQKIVLYAKSGEWWIQPFAAQPFTQVQADFAWRNRTHPGFGYAALLVNAAYHPSPRLDSLPERGGEVLAVIASQSPGLPHADGKTVMFGGYEWEARRNPNQPGGTRNDYDPANAWTDRRGFLHLRIAGEPGHWTSAEISLRRSLGYGSYRFVVRDLAHLEPAAVFNMSESDDGGTSREMDIEISKWGDPAARNGQFVIQPYHVPANTVRFQTPSGLTTFFFRWAPGQAAFKSFRGAVSNWDAPAVREHLFTSGVPAPGNDSIHMNLYVFGRQSNPLQKACEVIVENFEYLP